MPFGLVLIWFVFFILVEILPYQQTRNYCVYLSFFYSFFLAVFCQVLADSSHAYSTCVKKTVHENKSGERSTRKKRNATTKKGEKPLPGCETPFQISKKTLLGFFFFFFFSCLFLFFFLFLFGFVLFCFKEKWENIEMKWPRSIGLASAQLNFTFIGYWDWLGHNLFESNWLFYQ